MRSVSREVYYRAPAERTMHELSIAESIVDAVTAKAEDVAAARVEAIHLRLGVLSGVFEDALRFSLEVAAAGTAAAGARLEIARVPVTVFCVVCREERVLADQLLRCAVCGSPTPQVLRGTELELTALEVCDDQPSDS